jgi:HlyD family secretion protein
MHPRFRTDLTCSREEQQGVVFYRIDDPETRTSFRLYEIEYLIAQKLDGTRAITDVIHAVKDEYNFDISDADLGKFVNQLESMGFIAGPVAAAVEVGDDDVQDIDVIDTTPGADHAADVEGEPEVEPLLDVPETTVDKGELNRLLKSAFLHVKQGYVVHARDYFLAARELDPQSERLAKLVEHLKAIGDANGPPEVEYLWRHARELFPEVAQQVEDGFGAPAEHDLGTRLKWTVALLAVLVVGVGGLALAARELGVFESAARVRLQTLSAERAPVFYLGAATSVRPVEEASLKFEAAGVVAEGMVAAGDRVEAGQIIATLQLPPKVSKIIDKARAGVEKAEQRYEKARERLQEILSKREAVEMERAEAEEKLRELRPKSVLKQGGVSKQELEQWKKAKVRANKKLSQLAKKERQPREHEAKLSKQLEAARRKLAASEKRIAVKIVRAPFSGTVTDVKVTPGQQVEQGSEALVVRNTLLVRILFALDDAGGVQPGGEAQVAVDGGKPATAKVVSVTPGKADGAAKTEIEVELTDPAGAFVQMKPEAFRLVREFADRAFQVPSDSVCQQADGGQPYVIVALDSRALRRSVEVLDKGAHRAVIRDPAGYLRDGVQVVALRLDDKGTIAAIADGSFLEVSQ